MKFQKAHPLEDKMQRRSMGGNGLGGFGLVYDGVKGGLYLWIGFCTASVVVLYYHRLIPFSSGS
jgi:hypothetical protein